ncbi:MAG TPA: sigma-70 family RNA polymerase sigma factor [Acidimicrobiales bacterium]|jgi:RNA polymerase sigma-70 factor (ECF subfamily)|nr:sigma-70 family RNA polymerase sigma factor [Acidimicrobiales bacterium]
MGVHGVSDEALLAAFASGDPAFVRRFQRRVFGVALVIAGDPALAEDVAQESFVRAWRAAGAYDPRRGSVAAWLAAITRNLAIDTVRVRRLTPVDPDAIAALCLAGDAADPGEAAADADEARLLRAAIRDLPDGPRRALVLAVFGGRTAQEISEAEGIPLGTAKTRVRTAVLRLRDALVRHEL